MCCCNIFKCKLEQVVYMWPEVGASQGCWSGGAIVVGADIDFLGNTNSVRMDWHFS